MPDMTSRPGDRAVNFTVTRSGGNLRKSRSSCKPGVNAQLLRGSAKRERGIKIAGAISVRDRRIDIDAVHSPHARAGIRHSPRRALEYNRITEAERTGQGRVIGGDVSSTIIGNVDAQRARKQRPATLLHGNTRSAECISARRGSKGLR